MPREARTDFLLPLRFGAILVLFSLYIDRFALPQTLLLRPL